MEPEDNQKSTPSFDYHKLFYAVKNGNYEKVEQLLDKNCLKINDDCIGYKLIIYAVKSHCQLPIVELLVNSGCRVKGPKTNQYKTPLYYAVEGKKTLIVKFLLKAGASIYDKDVNTETPLYLALKKNYFEELDLMLSMYDVENIDIKSKDENIHFNIACMRNCVNLVKCFIEKGIDVNAVQDWHFKKWHGFTPLHFAVHNQSVDVLKILLKHGADFTKQTRNTLQSPLHLAFDSDKTDVKNEMIDLILNYHTSNTLNPVDREKVSHFHISCTRDNSAVVESFLKNGVDVNHLIKLPNSPVGLSALHLAVDFKKTENIRLLLLHGANVNFADDTKSTVLHMAVEDNNKEVIEILLEHGAKPNFKNLKFVSPWDLAVKHKLYGLYKLLLHHKAYVNSFDDTKSTALHRAVEDNNEEIIKMLVEYDADINLKNGNNFTPLSIAVKNRFYEIVKLLLQYRANPCIGDEKGISAIHIAYYDLPSSQEILDLMLSVDELRNTSDEENFSILHIACIRNNIKLVEKLLQSNNDVNACVNCEAKKWPGFTPLHFATYFYSYDLVKLLLQYKPNVNLREKNSYTPLWLALKFRFDNEIANRLNEKFLKEKHSFNDAGVDEDSVMEFLLQEIKQLQIVHALVTHNSDLNIKIGGRLLLFEACFPEVTWDINDDVANKNFIKNICSKFCDKNMKLNLKTLIKHGIDLNFTDDTDVSIFSHVDNANKSSNSCVHIDKTLFQHSQDAIMDLLTSKDAQK